MKTVAIIFNIVLFAFICLVLATDGAPKEAVYIVFTLWSLMTPILNVAVISRIGVGDGRLDLLLKRKTGKGSNLSDNALSIRTKMRIAAVTCNIIHIGFVCWAFADQVPYPKEDGLIAFTVLMMLTPILSLVVLFRCGASVGWLGHLLKRKALEK